jgi:SAM-dependent methyltransferase
MGENFSLADIHDLDVETAVERLTAEDVRRLQSYRNEFVELPCAVCRGTELSFAFESQGFQYKRCTRCGLLMLSPAPDAARQLWYINTSEALQFWRERMPDRVRSSRLKMYDERARFVRENVERSGSAMRRVLEIGAGNGEFAEALLRSSAGAVERMVLVEPQPLPLRLPQIEVVPTLLEEWGSGERFDLAVSWEVLEHILDPEPMLRAIFARLEAGGLLILSTPNEGSFETRLLLGRSTNLLYDHVRLYNPHTLQLLLERLGFEVLDLTTPGQLDVEIVHRQYQEGHLKLEGHPALQFLMEEGYSHRAEFQKFLCDRKLSGHMRCVARRPHVRG